MATQQSRQQPQAQPTAVTAEAANTAVSTESDNALAALYAEDAGAGREGATQDAYATPFLNVLQKGSPQVDEASGAVIEGARAGMLWGNISNKLYDGKKGVIIVPAAYRRVFLRWAPRDLGGGFRGEVAPEVAEAMLAKGEVMEVENRLLFPLKETGELNPKKCDSLQDVRNHYVLVIDPATGIPSPALLSLGSTQIKKSKMLMSALSDVKVQGPKGLITPPTWANQVRLTTVPEQNDKGTWFGVKLEIVGRVTDPDIYRMAKEFHASVMAGKVDVKYEAAQEDSARGGSRMAEDAGKF